MIDVDKLCSLADYIDAAKFLLVFIKHGEFIYDDDAISVIIQAIVFSKEKHSAKVGKQLFGFTVDNAKRFLYRWMYTQYRAKSREPLRKELSAKLEDPLSLLIEEEKRQKIDQLIEVLPDKKKACVKLLYHEGLNRSEIARRMDMSPQAVRLMFMSMKKIFHSVQ